MKSARPKVLHPLAGRPMIGHALDAVRRLRPARTVVVVGDPVEEEPEAVRQRSWLDTLFARLAGRESAR